MPFVLVTIIQPIRNKNHKKKRLARNAAKTSNLSEQLANVLHAEVLFTSESGAVCQWEGETIISNLEVTVPNMESVREKILQKNIPVHAEVVGDQDCLEWVNMCPNVQILTVSKTSIGNLRPLESTLRTVRVLRVKGIHITDLGQLNVCERLEVLHLDGCDDLQSVDQLSTLTCLRVLSLSGTAVEDLRPLSDCKTLEDLSIAGCHKITDLSPLAGLENLKKLQACESGVRTIGELWKCSKLEEADFSGCRELRDTKDFSKAEALKVLSMPLANLQISSIGDSRTLFGHVYVGESNVTYTHSVYFYGNSATFLKKTEKRIRDAD